MKRLLALQDNGRLLESSATRGQQTYQVKFVLLHYLVWLSDGGRKGNKQLCRLSVIPLSGSVVSVCSVSKNALSKSCRMQIGLLDRPLSFVTVRIVMLVLGLLAI